MAADADLPVWTIKPNWSDGILERLSWLTDVIASTFGPEQRRALRLSPRREFEMKFNPVDQARSYFDLFLHRLGSAEFMLPLFHDAGKMTAEVAAGAVTIPLDTTYREFVIGGLAVIIGDDPFTFDEVSITDIQADHLTVAAGGVTQTWPKGSKIHPLRRARLSDESQVSALTSRVGDGTLQFQLNQANDLPDEGDWDTLYLDYPIILDPPNRRENLDLTFNRNSLLLDNDHGLRALNDDTASGATKARAFTVQVDQRMMVGRAEHWAFRQMLYRLRGQQGTVWLPTFNRDIVLSQAALAADAKLDVKKIGYAYTGGAVDGRQHVMLPGGLGAKIIGTAAPLSAAEERLTLSAALGADLPAGTFGSFMDTCRLASDDIEIKHYTDTDGAAESNVGFRSFRDPRTAPAIIDYPIPATVMGVMGCGSPAPEEADCVTLESGFWAEVTFNLAAGAFVPHEYPASWTMQFYRGGVLVNDSLMEQSDNYTTYAPADPSTGRCTSFVTRYYMPSDAPPGEGGFATDPFAAGRPDQMSLDMQFGVEAFPEGDGLMTVAFRRPNEAGAMLVVMSGGTTVPIFALWPAHYDYSVPA